MEVRKYLLPLNNECLIGPCASKCSKSGCWVAPNIVFPSHKSPISYLGHQSSAYPSPCYCPSANSKWQWRFSIPACLCHVLSSIDDMTKLLFLSSFKLKLYFKEKKKKGSKSQKLNESKLVSVSGFFHF